MAVLRHSDVVRVHFELTVLRIVPCRHRRNGYLQGNMKVINTRTLCSPKELMFHTVITQQDGNLKTAIWRQSHDRHRW